MQNIYMKMSDAQINERIKVVKIHCEKQLKSRLGAIGLFEGVIAYVAQKYNGLAAIKMLNTKIAIEDSILEQIDVEKI